MLYFQIAQAIICLCNDHEAAHFSWPRLQQGFAAIEQQYGTSLVELNSLAVIAFRLDDSVVANSTFTRIGYSWDKEAWGTEARFKKYKDWAALWSPGETRSRAIKQQAFANLQAAGGLSYKKDFDLRFAALEQSCLQDSREDLSKSEFLVQIGKDGIVQNGWMTHPSALATCLLRRLDASNARKEKLFLAPPHDEYWVIFDVDPAALSTAAKE